MQVLRLYLLPCSRCASPVQRVSTWFNTAYFHAVQVDSFNRAQSGRMSRRISRLWSGKKSPKTPSPEGKTMTTPGGGNVTLDEMLIYQPVRRSACTRFPIPAGHVSRSFNVLSCRRSGPYPSMDVVCNLEFKHISRHECMSVRVFMHGKAIGNCHQAHSAASQMAQVTSKSTRHF